MLSLCALVLIFDLLLGEPPNRFHPTVWMGRLVALLERLLYARDGVKAKILGAVLVLIVCAAAGVPAWLVQHFLFKHLPWWAAGPAVCALASLAVGCRSLVAHARRVFHDLVAMRTPEARRSLSMIVGRDTGKLGRSEVCRASVESLAESLGDGVLAPLFFFLLFGLPGIFIYRAANTMDSMLGHKDGRYSNFGWAAARLDDLFNFIPARLLAIPSIAAAALVCKLKFGKSIAVAVDEHSNSHSPSAGWYEAAFAGALDVVLGGTNHYDGVPREAPLFNRGAAKCRAKDIADSIRLVVGASFASALLLDLALCVAKIMP